MGDFYSYTSLIEAVNSLPLPPFSLRKFNILCSSYFKLHPQHISLRTRKFICSTYDIHSAISFIYPFLDHLNPSDKIKYSIQLNLITSYYVQKSNHNQESFLF